MQVITKTTEYMTSRSLRLCVLFLIIGLFELHAQVNAPVIRVQVQQGETLEGLELFSLDNIVTIDAFEANESGGGFTTVIEKPGRHRLRYTAQSDFEGIDIGVFECMESLFGPKTYVTLEIEVVRSLIEANDDFLQLGVEEIVVEFDPTTNDTSSVSPINVLKIENVFGGAVVLDHGNIVRFTPNKDFVGLASFSYIIIDQSGSTASASVYIIVKPDQISKVDTINLVHMASDPLLINLPISGLSVSESSVLSHGTISFNSAQSLIYTTDSYVGGYEEFTLKNDQGYSRTYRIELVQGQEIQSILVDDIAYTSRGQYVTIDARSNDYKNDGVVVDYSKDLIYSSGIFAYIPESEFEGVKEFYYTVHDGQRSYTAYIDIYVGNYMPAISQYNFEVKKNIPFVWEYNIPIKNYRFNIIAEPNHGELVVNQTTFGSTACDRTTGYQMFSYTPTNGYVGTDEFIVQYCVLEGSCKELTIHLDIVDSDDDCGCVGPDCVWSGDTNQDGVVNMADLLSIGQHYGESGGERSISDNSWEAERAQDWRNKQINQTNVKHVDANGDGVISVADTGAILANYNRFDNIVASTNILDKSIPVQFVLNQSEISNGDFVSIDIHLGSAEHPVVDLHGVALPIKIPSTLINDSSTVEFVPNTSWIGSNSPIIHLSKQPNANQIDIGVTRTSDVGVSGTGSIGSINTVIIIDIDEIRPDESEIPITIEIPSSMFVDGAGQQYALEGTSLTLIVNLKEEDSNTIITDDIDVLISPNPSDGNFRFHANNNDELTEIGIFNLIGENILTISNINAKSYRLSTNLGQGMYLAHIKTAKGFTTQKIEVFK